VIGTDRRVDCSEVGWGGCANEGCGCFLRLRGRGKECGGEMGVMGVMGDDRGREKHTQQYLVCCGGLKGEGGWAINPPALRSSPLRTVVRKCTKQQNVKFKINAF
jgi:hypothetical protein